MNQTRHYGNVDDFGLIIIPIRRELMTDGVFVTFVSFGVETSVVVFVQYFPVLTGRL